MMKLHLRFGGQSRTREAHELGVNGNSSDQEIRQKLARYYELSANQLAALVVDRHPDGVVVRPPAVFG